MRYFRTHTKQPYKNPQFDCDILNKFYEGKTVQMYDTTMFGLSSYNDYTMQSGIEDCDLINHVYKYHKYIPESSKLFEFLLNSDIDINMSDRNGKGILFTSLIMNNELKWLSMYMSSRWFDDSIIGKVYLFGNAHMTPLQYTIKNQQLPMFNILMQYGAVPYNGIETDLANFKITSTVKLRELFNTFKLLGITDPIEKIFGIYLNSYDLDLQINKYFMKQKFDINHLIDGQNYLMILMSVSHDPYNNTFALVTDLVTWMIRTGIDVNYVNHFGHGVIYYLKNHTHVNIDVLINLINAGVIINSPSEILIKITRVDGIQIELLEVILPKLSKAEVINTLNILAEIYVQKTGTGSIDVTIFDQFGFDANIIKTLRNAKLKAEIEKLEQERLQKEKEKAKIEEHKKILVEQHLTKMKETGIYKPEREEKTRRHLELMVQQQIDKAIRLGKLIIN